MTASVGDCSVRLQDDFQDPNCFSLEASGVKSAFLADLFASVSFTAQHGKFQRLFLDLTQFHACLGFPSGSRLLSGATNVVHDLINSRQPSLEDVQSPMPAYFFSSRCLHLSLYLSCLYFCKYFPY